MKLAVSNIAWTPQEAVHAYRILSEQGFTGLEIAPGLLFAGSDDPFAPSSGELKGQMTELSGHGLTCISMQSLLFGVSGAALFGDDHERRTFERGISRAIHLAGRMGVGNLVLGCPKQRVIPDGMPASKARDLAIECLQRLGDLAAAEGTCIGLEANPEAYGTNFLNTFDEVTSLLTLLDHPAVRATFDFGATQLNQEGEEYPTQLILHAPLVNHVHVSAPHLALSPSSDEIADPLLGSLKASGYASWISIEMKRPTGGLGDVATCVQRLAAAATRISE